jgi:hypothetical protein
MIKLFRQTRKNLLMENKTSKSASPSGKYFKYAIGEIILVVIGILIALQLNNWNEGRNNRNTEIKTLSQLNIDLKSNLEEITEIREYLVLTNGSGKKILEHLDSKEQITDSLKLWVEIFSGRSIFNNANTIYKTIQNNNKNAITNDSLRLEITLMYEQDFENIHKREIMLNEEYFALYTLELNKNFKTSPSISRDSESPEPTVNTPIDLAQLKTNEQYKNTLVETSNFKSLCILKLTQTLARLKVLIAAVDSEIVNLESN